MGKRLVRLTLQPVGLMKAGVRSNPHIYHDFLYVVPRVSVSRRTLQCRVRHFTSTYVMTNELYIIISCYESRTIKYSNLMQLHIKKLSILYMCIISAQ